MGEDSLLERVTAAAEERQLSQNTLTAYLCTWPGRWRLSRNRAATSYAQKRVSSSRTW
jgi:hypothetical protein